MTATDYTSYAEPLLTWTRIVGIVTAVAVAGLAWHGLCRWCCALVDGVEGARE